jgi:ubiquitin C-terminal hydrolase
MVRYKLVGTVNHFGTLNRGHYFAEIRHSDGRWY